MRRSKTRGRDGDFLRIDDRTGFTVWASETQKEWNGLVVHRSHYQARHPQDFIRAPRERFGVPDPRPDRSIANSNFTGPLTTTIAAPVTAAVTWPDQEPEGGGSPIGLLLTITQQLDFPVATGLQEASLQADNEAQSPFGAVGEFAIGQNAEDDHDFNAAGSTKIKVDSTSGMSSFDRLGILLDSGDLFFTQIWTVNSATTIQLVDPLPGRVSVGNLVTDYTVVS